MLVSTAPSIVTFYKPCLVWQNTVIQTSHQLKSTGFLEWQKGEQEQNIFNHCLPSCTMWSAWRGPKGWTWKAHGWGVSEALGCESSYGGTPGPRTLWISRPSPNIPYPPNSHWGSSPIPRGWRAFSWRNWEEFPGSGSYFIRHRKKGSCLRPQPEIHLQQHRYLLALIPPSRMEIRVGILPGEFPRLIVAKSRAVSLAGQAALLVVVRLGGPYGGWGESAGGQQQRGAAPPPADTWRLDSISGSSDSRWVASAMFPTPAPQRTIQKVGRSVASLGEKTASPLSPACGPQGLHLPLPPLGKPGKISVSLGCWGQGGMRDGGDLLFPRWHTFSPQLHTEAPLDSVPGSTISTPLKIQKQQNTKPKISKSINRHTQRQQRPIVSSPSPNFSWFYVKIWVFHLVIFSFLEEKINTILELHTHFTCMSSFAVIGPLLTLRISDVSSWPSGLVAANPQYPGSGLRASWRGPGYSTPPGTQLLKHPKGKCKEM